MWPGIGRILGIVLMAVAAALLGLTVIRSGPIGASTKVNPKDRVTCADLGVMIHDTADGLNTSPDIAKMVRRGCMPTMPPFVGPTRALKADSSQTSNTAALRVISSACSRHGAPARLRPNDYFIGKLRSTAPEVTLADAVKFEGLGRVICSDLRGGRTISDEVNFLSRKLATDVSVGVLSEVGAYCPQFEGKLQQFARSG